ncbi:MAG: bifunctional UDP-N-acetylglucosamine diphosphorylase/glucosamine-1-phosphate N-acetyltransferase GlmU [Alphaproteobacteria bacterium]|nr:bifunctional UDP-N-acetylglucosamine diphosphorylase/glucosamine-1-phosphate N-acetyltransferase GlmU [Alphaproteobacteria bacterium]
MSKRSCLAIVLAAGEGTRMRSARPKVLHAVAGRSLLAHVLHAVRGAGMEACAVVVGPDCEPVAAEARAVIPKAEVFVQHERRGTAHAVLVARDAIKGADDVIVIFGDTPLITVETLKRLRGAIDHHAAIAVLGFRAANPTGYGRLITNGHRLVAIREEKEASDIERRIDLCNGGLMALRGDCALDILDRIDDANGKREFYLTDAVTIADGMALEAVALETTENEVHGINTRAQLAQAEAMMQERLRAAALDAGVTMAAPQTVFLSADTRLGRDVTIEPNVVFGPGVVVEDNAVIHAFSHLEGAHVGKGASVGPFARLRPGAKLGAKSRIGNFVEVKAAEIGEGAKANHLAYIGDGAVGAGANIGAGTIFCNYDGKNKHRTQVGKHAFIGSNSALVAPVTVGDNAYVGSGSVITDNVPPGALAIGRGRQVIKQDWAPGQKKQPKAAAAKSKPKTAKKAGAKAKKKTKR